MRIYSTVPSSNADQAEGAIFSMLKGGLPIISNSTLGWPAAVLRDPENCLRQTSRYVWHGHGICL